MSARVIRYLAQYGAYHRDRRNLATHVVGIPMIVLALEVLLSRPAIGFDGESVSLAVIASVLAGLFYLWLDIRLGLVMTALLALGVWAGGYLASLPTVAWLAWGVGLFVVGWALQFAGHAWEGKRPAFVDDLVGLLIGPLFVVAEIGFCLGLRRGLSDAVEREAQRSG